MQALLKRRTSQLTRTRHRIQHHRQRLNHQVLENRPKAAHLIKMVSQLTATIEDHVKVSLNITRTHTHKHAHFYSPSPKSVAHFNFVFFFIWFFYCHFAPFAFVLFACFFFVFFHRSFCSCEFVRCFFVSYLFCAFRFLAEASFGWFFPICMYARFRHTRIYRSASC